jgi:outer membrane cobalamin receptor
MRKTTLLAASALSTMAAAWAAQAQPARAQTAPAPTEVESVQVTARNLEDTLPEQLAQTGVKVEVVSGQQIRDGGYQDVATALQTLAPGLFILPENGPYSSNVDVSLLGSRSQDVLWLVDGVRINNRLTALQNPLDSVPAGIVDRIEVLDGGQSLFYGTEAIGGAINIVTRPFTDALSGSLRLSGDSNTDRHVDANLSDGTKFGQFVVYASADKSDGYQAFRDQDYQPSAGDHDRWYEVLTEGLKYQVDLTSQLRLQASYQRSDNHLDLAAPYRASSAFDTRGENLASVKLDYQATDKLAFFVKGYWHDWAATNSLFLTNPFGGAAIPVYNKAFFGYKDYGLNALGKYDVAPGLQAYFGYDLQTYGGRDDSLAITQHNETVNAGFGQLRWNPVAVPDLNLAAGFRYNAPSTGPSTTVWNVSGRYQLPMGVYIKGEGGTNFTLPTAEQLFTNDPVAGERGNPNLKPETSIGGELTLGSRFDVAGHATTLEVTGFARDIRNVIDLATFDAATDQDVYGNLPGVVTTRGGQFELQTAVTASVKAHLAVTYNETKDETGVQLNNVPLQMLKGGFDWSPSNLPVGVTANLNYTGKATTLYQTRNLNYGEYATVDLSGRYFLDPARHHQLNLAVQNLFDRSYGVFYRGCADVLRDFPLGCSKPYPYQAQAMPRTVSLSYRYSF